MKVYIVTAEANRLPSTNDGMWFHILGVFRSEKVAQDFREKAILSGEWGEYVISRGAVTDRPKFDSDWQIGIYEEEVQKEITDVPQGYAHHFEHKRLATPAAKMARKRLLYGLVPKAEIPEYVLLAMRQRDWLKDYGEMVALFDDARTACADESIED